MGVQTLLQARKRMIDNVNQIKNQMGASFIIGYKGPNDNLAHELGIEIVEENLEFDDGFYLAAESEKRPKPIIGIDPFSSDFERVNFTYYHEICHHLLRMDDDLYSFLNDLAHNNYDFDYLVDYFANIGAAEFLIPSSEIFSLINLRGFTIKLLPELDKIYPASKPAIAIQMAQCASHRCFVVVCKYGYLPSQTYSKANLFEIENVIRKELYVEYSSNSPHQEKYSIGKCSVLPEKHLFSQALKDQNYVKGKDFIPFKNRNYNWLVDCEGLFYMGKIYGVFNTSNPNDISPYQLSFFKM